MRSVKYMRASSWGQAAQALKKNPASRPIAGGSDLLGWFKDGIAGKDTDWESLLFAIRHVLDHASPHACHPA